MYIFVPSAVLRLRASAPDDSGGSSDGTSEAATAASGASATDWITAGIIFGSGIVLAFVAAWITRRLVRNYNEMIATLLGRIVGGVFFIIGFVYALSTLGVAVAPLLGGLGIGGLAVAFALRDILENMLAGVLIQLRRPFEIGHLVKLDDRLGRVQDVTLRAVEIDAVDGERVIIPASNVIHNTIENWSTNGHRRSEVVIGVPYDADLPPLLDRLREGLRDLDGGETERDPMVLVDEFAGSSVNIRALVWHHIDEVHFLEFASRLAVKAKQIVNEAGYEVPFPIRTLDVPENSPLAQVGSVD